MAVANQLPANVVLLNRSLEPQRVFPLEGQPSAVYAVPGEERFVLTLRDVPRLESIGYPDGERRSVEIRYPDRVDVSVVVRQPAAFGLQPRFGCTETS